MRKLLLIGLMLVFIVSASLMATGQKETTKGEEQVEIEFWWWGEEDAPGFSKYIDAVCEEYHNQNPNVTVTPVLQSTADTIPAFLAAAEAQSGPDIATIWYGMYNLETAVWPGHAVPLDDYISEEEMSHWIGRELESYDGKVWASDLYAYATVIAYNKEQFREAGLDPENPPKTWEEFMAASKQLKDAGFAPFAAGFQGGWMFPVFGYFIYPQFFSFQEIKDAVLGKISFTDPRFVEYWKALDEYASAGYFIEAATSIDLAPGYQEWRKGNGAMVELASQQAMLWLEELGSKKMGIMSWPEMNNQPVDWIPVCKNAEFITSWSPHKEIAADFLKFLHSEKSYELMREIHPVSVPPDDRFDVNTVEDPQKREIFEMIYEGYKKETYFIDSIIPYPIMGDGMIPAGQKLVVQQLSPEEAAQMMEDAAQTWREMNPEALEKYKIWAGEN